MSWECTLCTELVSSLLKKIQCHLSSSTYSEDEFQCHFQSNSYVLNRRSAKFDLQLLKGLLWIPSADFGIVPHFVSMILKIRDASMSTMLLVHNGSDNTLSIHGGYVHVNEGHVECGSRLLQSKLGIRLERHNQLHLRRSSIILIDDVTPIHHHSYLGEFWLEELLNGNMCSDVNTSA
jgi:hypothetical protein